MKNSVLYALWGCWYIVCAGLGFIPEPEGAAAAARQLAGLVFFLPPVLILIRSGKRGDIRSVQLVRSLSLASLAATVLLLILNFFSAFFSEFWGNALYYALAIASAPMFCFGSWAVSLFLWACLLTASGKRMRSIS